MWDLFQIYDLTQTKRLFPKQEIMAYGEVCVSETWIYAEPNSKGAIQSQYTFGERLNILAQLGQWFLTQSQMDQYSGWIKSSDVILNTVPFEKEMTHRTINPTPILSQSNLKSAFLGFLPQDGFFIPEKEENNHYLIANLGWVDKRNCGEFNQYQNIIETAHQQLNKTYVWGGRGITGLDCSALAQYCYRRAGKNIPRDSDLQHLFFQKHHQKIELDELMAGDLIFIKGHVMIAINNKQIIHASGYHLRVVLEDLNEALQRYKQDNPDLIVQAYRWSV